MKYLLAILALYLLLTIPSVYTKIPWCDEAWQAAPAFDLLEGGTMGTTCYEPDGSPFLRLDERTYWEPPMHYWSQAAWCSVFGKGLFQVRYHSVFWGVVLLMSVYCLVGGLLYHRGAALLATGLLAIDFNFVYAASGNRMDMMSIALTVAGLAAYVRLRKNYFELALVFSNTLIVLGGLTHPNGILGAAALLLMVLYMDRKRLNRGHLWTVMAPYMVGALAWGCYIVQDFEAFTSQFGCNFDTAAGSRFYGLTDPLQAVRDEIVIRYGEGYGFVPTASKQAIAKLVILISYLAGACIYWHSRKNVALLRWTWLIYAAGLAILMGSKTPTYLIYITPFFAILLAAFIVRLWYITDRKVLIGWLVVIFSINVAITVHRVAQNQYSRNHLPAAAELSKLIDEDTVFMGSGEWGFTFGFENVIDDVQLGCSSGLVPDVVIICSRYSLYHDPDEVIQCGLAIPLDEPTLSYVHDLLKRYNLRWENEFYEIYTRD